jgi:hypothetical protein
MKENAIDEVIADKQKIFDIMYRIWINYMYICTL